MPWYDRLAVGVIYAYLCSPQYLSHMLKEEAEKQIDEARQGEALELATNGKAVKKLYMESYGCAMNFSDSEVVASVLQKDGYATTTDVSEADVIFINTCAIRDNAEKRIRVEAGTIQHN